MDFALSSVFSIMWDTDEECQCVLGQSDSVWRPQPRTDWPPLALLAAPFHALLILTSISFCAWWSQPSTPPTLINNKTQTPKLSFSGGHNGLHWRNATFLVIKHIPFGLWFQLRWSPEGALPPSCPHDYLSPPPCCQGNLIGTAANLFFVCLLKWGALGAPDVPTIDPWTVHNPPARRRLEWWLL